MKTHQYISSGILEAYLLGLASDEEKKDVERMMATHPEIAIRVNELEDNIEALFMHNAVPPPPGLRDKIELRIKEEGLTKWEDTHSYRNNGRAEDTQADKSGYIDVQVSNTHIQVHKYWRAAFIAVFILSKIFLAFGLYYYFKSNSLEQEINRLNNQVQQTTGTATNRQ